LVTPSVPSVCARVFEVIADPRSLWMMSAPGSMLWRAQLSAISCLASAPDSRSAISQPTTYRLKMSSRT
jgi:hypothetical protein